MRQNREAGSLSDREWRISGKILVFERNGTKRWEPVKMGAETRIEQ